MGHLIAASILLPLFLGLIGGFLIDASDTLAERLVEMAAARLIPIQRADKSAEWRADMATFQTKFGRSRWAIECYLASLFLEPPFALQKHRAKRKFFRFVMITELNSLRYAKYLARREDLPEFIRFNATKHCWEVRQRSALFFSMYKKALVAVCVREQVFEDAETIIENELDLVRSRLKWPKDV